MSTLRRQTRETQVFVRLARRGSEEAGAGFGVDGGQAESRSLAQTGQPFFDHMLTTLGRYADLALQVQAEGDLKHHLIEDVAITLGQALRQEIPETCTRYGSATVVMDDALVQVTLDAGGRPYYQGPVPSDFYEHFFRSLADNAAMTLHVVVLRGRDRHHIVEAAVKALGLALRTALAPGTAVFSTKGSVRFGREEA
jgi:imidazoleglycerol-phosphate dehydratase